MCGFLALTAAVTAAQQGALEQYSKAGGLATEVRESLYCWHSYLRNGFQSVIFVYI
jgi:hypothetical protein